MLIVDAEVLQKIDENRGEMSRVDFINFLIESRFSEQADAEPAADFITKEEFTEFSQGIKDLLRNFLEFFLSYGLELGKQPKDHAFEELTRKLQALDKNSRKT